MKKRFRTIAFIACAGLGLASCGGESELSEAGGSIDQATLTMLLTTTAFSDLTSSIVPSGTGSISLPVPGLPSGVGSLGLGKLGTMAGQADFGTCTVTSGAKTDGVDGDGVPASYREEFNCFGINGTSDLTGFMQMTDYDDTKHGVAGGYLFEFDITYNDRFGHENNFGVWRGTWGVTTSATQISMTSTYSSEAGSIPTADPDNAERWKVQNNHSTVYTPTDMASPWQAGAMTFSGYSRFSGRLYSQAQATVYPLDVTFRVESSNLTYDRTACPGSFFKDGSFTFSDGAGNRFTYTYVNCVQSRAFNGSAI